MKKIYQVFAIAALLSLVLVPGTVRAEDESTPPANKIKALDIRQDIKEKVRTTVKNKVAHLISGEITAINGTTLTVAKDGKSYTVNTSSTTQFRRHFWGKSELSEFSVGNKVNVWGVWTDETKTTINAKMIRNLSIMKRFGVFLGTVKSKEANSFVMLSLKREEQTAMFDSNTKFVDRAGRTITFAEVNVGDRIRVKGLWDKSLSKITEVVQVKDYSLPKRPTPQVTTSAQ